MKKKIKIFFILFLAFLLIYKLAVFFILINFVKEYEPVLLETFSAKLGREISIRGIKVNFLGGISFSGLEIYSLGEEDPLEKFTAERLLIHLNFLNLIQGKKDYLRAFRKVSFQRGSLKLRSLKRSLESIKGRFLITNGDFCVERLRFPLGESNFILKGWVRDFAGRPAVELNMEAPDFKIGDLSFILPGFKSLKLTGQGSFSCRLTGALAKPKIIGEVWLKKLDLGKFRLSQIKSNFYFGDGFINFSPFEAKILKGKISGKIKITSLFSEPNLAGQIEIEALQLLKGRCSGKLKAAGPLLKPEVSGEFSFSNGDEKFSLEKVSCQLYFMPQGMRFKNGEVKVPKLGTILCQGELKDDLSYGLYYYLPSLKSRNLASYIKRWPDLPGVFKAEGKIKGNIASSEVNYEGKFVRDNLGKVKAVNWKVRKEKNLVEIENLSLEEGLNITGSINFNPCLLKLQLLFSDFSLASQSLNGKIKLNGGREALFLEGSVLSSEEFVCRLKGRKKENELKITVDLEGKKVPSVFHLSLAGEMRSDGFAGEISAHPIIIRKKEYRPLNALIKADSEKLIIEKLKWLGAYFGEAKVNFSPLIVSFNLFLEEADITPILSFSSAFAEEENYGMASGRIEGKGNWPKLNIEGVVELRDSKIAAKNIKYAKFQFAGVSPYITLKKSPVLLDGTTLICQGVMDLRKPGKVMFKDVDYILDENQMVWKGWKINQEEEEKELSLTKEVSGGFAVSLRAPTVDVPGESLTKEPGPEMELEYSLKGREKLKFRIDEEDDFVGIEHEIEF